MRITFYGAASEVTGSCNLVEVSDFRFLVDCGMFQGHEKTDSRNKIPRPRGLQRACRSIRSAQVVGTRNQTEDQSDFESRRESSH